MARDCCTFSRKGTRLKRPAVRFQTCSTHTLLNGGPIPHMISG